MSISCRRRTSYNISAFVLEANPLMFNVAILNTSIPLGEADRLCSCLLGECVSRTTTFTYVRSFPDIFYFHLFVILGLINWVYVLLMF